MIISIASLKGGVGKTVLATNIAAALAKQGATVLYVDGSPFPDSLNWFEYREENAAENIQKISHIKAQNNLAEIIRQNRDEYEYVIVDAPSVLHAEINQAILAADILIGPIRPSQIDLDTIPALEIVAIHAKTFNPNLKAYSLISIAPDEDGIDPEASETNNTKTFLKHNYPGLTVLETVVSDKRLYRESYIEGMGVVEFEEGVNVCADEINALLKEILNV